MDLDGLLSLSALYSHTSRGPPVPSGSGATDTGDNSPAPAQLARLTACLQSPLALAASFRHAGGAGAPDFAAICGAVSSIVVPAALAEAEDGANAAGVAEAAAELRAREIMEALSAAVSGAWRSREGTAAASAEWPPGAAVEQEALPGGSAASGGSAARGGHDATQDRRWGSWERGWSATAPEAGEAPEEPEEPEAGRAAEVEVDGTAAGGADGLQALHVDMMVDEGESGHISGDEQSWDREAGATAGAEPPFWILVAWAAALPLLQDALPKDSHGDCVLPHRHRMRRVDADKERMERRIFNARIIYLTSKVCDRCMEQIQERVFYHCSKDCDVDFCARCHEELQSVLDNFFAGGGAARSCAAGVVTSFADHAIRRMLWSVHMTDCIARQILYRGPRDRMTLARMLAFEWPVELFAQLVRAVVDVCNAKMLYNATKGAMTTSVRPASGGQYEQEVRPIYKDNAFWCSIGLLQFLYACNELPRERVLDGHGMRGPRIDCQCFILEGINKCKPDVEWKQWLKHPLTRAVDVLRAESFGMTRSFRSLVAHSNLLPISFRRRCLLVDVWGQMDEDRSALQLRVEREPAALVDAVTQAFSRCRNVGEAAAGAAGAAAAFQGANAGQLGPTAAPRGEPGGAADVAAETEAAPRQRPLGHSPGETDAAAAAAPGSPVVPTRLRRPLSVAFEGEGGRGPGVQREFFQVAMRAFLQELFEPTGSRTYWFGSVDRPDAYFACGVLLGQAVLHDVLIPSVFPWTLFDLLLRDLGSPRAASSAARGGPGLAHLAAVAPAEADALQKVLDYQDADIAAHFGELGWERAGSRLLGRNFSQDTKASFVQEYVTWCLGDRIAPQFRPLSEGFQAVLGSSSMVRQMVDAKHLERIVCGGEVPVDISAISRRATLQGWAEDERAYIDAFWQILDTVGEAEKRSFLIFVTASDREPLRGWGELRLTVQKNGFGDDRLPTAYTCFSLLLLPKYSCKEVLTRNLLQAITNSEGFGLY